jgi:hypothetical protein
MVQRRVAQVELQLKFRPFDHFELVTAVRYLGRPSKVSFGYHRLFPVNEEVYEYYPTLLHFINIEVFSHCWVAAIKGNDGTFVTKIELKQCLQEMQLLLRRGKCS